jgi:very-short-patch-repair endonuclease
MVSGRIRPEIITNSGCHTPWARWLAMHLDVEMVKFAEEQQGAVGIWQLRALGVDESALKRLRQSAGWYVASRRVLVRSGAPQTELQQVAVALLDASPGAAVCGPTAAWMWGAPGFGPEPVHLVRPKGIARRDSRLARLHDVRDLHPRHLKVLQGLTVTSPARAVCELAATHPHRVERVLDRFWSDRLLDGATFRRTVEEYRDRGRKGSTLLRELDAARGPGYVPPASALERRFEEILARHGLPPMRRQVDSGDEEWCGRVDYRDTVLPLIVEVQSTRFHAALVDRVADARRRARLEAAGFTVVEVWDHEVWHDARVVVELVESTRRRLRRPAV